MRKLYQPNTANFPRLKTDTFFADYANQYQYNGVIGWFSRFIEEFQLLDPVHWKRFVDQFRIHSDTEKGWRGEYWGKMMRGACFVYASTRNPELYRVLNDTVRDMLTAMEPSGRISSYPLEGEFDGWDIWCRKYVLLGMQYFLEISEDEALNEEIVASMCRQLDYIMSKVGPEGIPIVKASHYWRGLNSSSLLEPVVRLYNLTGKQEYLEAVINQIMFEGI